MMIRCLQRRTRRTRATVRRQAVHSARTLARTCQHCALPRHTLGKRLLFRNLSPMYTPHMRMPRRPPPALRKISSFSSSHHHHLVVVLVHCVCSEQNSVN